MPRWRRHWCNANFDLTLDARPRTTIWSGRATGLPVFRTWLRPGEDPPPSTSHLAEYRHVAMVPEHLHRQARIAALQGDGGVWAAGMYTAGVDNHESALRSALRVAERLASFASSRKASFSGACGKAPPAMMMPAAWWSSHPIPQHGPPKRSLRATATC